MCSKGNLRDAFNEIATAIQKTSNLQLPEIDGKGGKTFVMKLKLKALNLIGDVFIKANGP